ncbi:branched-chain amino acid ABC transporter permease [Salinarimonas soli]|uniref:Branched-chain amino acid ABC transporter permease n=1 Tax=Salinarimonas soli TaxID=1638099 RepID=A0A5B2V9B9_9HYPH|nr:hypothetical protein [Salinarimonas soli]KAA2235614.1 hypothetical protein F0L46_19130 [Salinarimonas soli]
MIALRMLLLALLLGLAACQASVDAEQARVCRQALPALNPDGGRIGVQRIAPGTRPREIRIDYEVVPATGAPRDRFAYCLFAASGLDPSKSELIGVTTETGIVAPATVYFLRRFYLGSPEALAADPGLGEGAAGLVELPPALAYALQQAVAGLPKIATFGLLAGAYAMVFGLVGRINLAFGELAAVGAAATTSGVAIMTALGTADLLAGLGLGLVLAVFAAGLHGLVGTGVAIGWVRSSRAALIATVGLSIALMEYLRLVRGPIEVWVPPVFNETMPLARAGSFVVTVTPMSLFTGGIGLLAATLLLRLMTGSAFGRQWRAYADDPGAAALFGIDGGRLLNRTLALASALAGLAGFLTVVQYGSLGFAGGFQLGLKALVGAVLGGIGSIPGALLGGLAIGIFEVAWSATMPIEGRDIAVYAALIVFLVFRPGGLLGWKHGNPRQV